METYTENKVASLVRKMESDYLIGETQRSKYVSENFYEDLCKIDAYLSSKHTSGSTDSMDREKPFFNIVLAARNIWFRATDIDRKNIRIKAGKAKDYIPSFLATVHLQDYMRRENFGQFLNDWGLTLASYNSAVCKFVEQDGRLNTRVVPWQNLIVDTINFEDNPKVEILEMTEAQLRKNKSYNQEMVEGLCDAFQSRETLDGTKKDNKSEYIKLYEVHGEFPLSYLTGKEKDEDEYVQQMHIVSFVANEGGKHDDFTLYSGREKQDPYLLTSLIKNTDGSISLDGAVKNLFEAQWMTNHSVYQIKNQLDLASKVWFQTCDPKFAGQNVTENIETGQIAVWDKNIPNGQLTQVNNTSHDITSLQSFGQQWQVLAQELSSTPDIMKGQNMPSGTAFRQAAIIQQESHSNFEIMTENKGLAIEEMLRRYIIPYLKKQMDTSEEVSATLEDYDITKIDSIYIPNEAVKRFNQKAVEAVINQTELPDLQEEMQGVKQELGAMGNQRFFKPSEIDSKTWKSVFKDFQWEAIVDPADEAIDKQMLADNLVSIFQSLVGMQGREMTPNEKLVFNKALEVTGSVSPIELSTNSSQPQPQQPMAQMPQRPNNQPMLQMQQ